MGFFAKLKEGLKKTRDHFTKNVDDLVENTEKIDDDFYDSLTDILILADCGANVAEDVVQKLQERVKKDHIRSAAEAREVLKDLLVSEMDIPQPEMNWPVVMLIVGVNGVGKTTTIGKLALRFQEQNKTVMLAAADTYRAAADEQLAIWAERANVPIIRSRAGQDPASVVYDAVHAAKAKGTDLLIVDTAGRLHNKKNLMDELSKMRRIIDREFPEASVQCMMVLDATTGQNGIQQARQFKEATNIGGIIMTKLDGTAKGGIAIAVRRELDLPVWYIGVGEGIDDLQPFNAREFVDALF